MVNDENRRKLLKEVVGRARKEEKDEYVTILERQIAIAKRLDEIKMEIEVLSERDKQNKYPEQEFRCFRAPDKTHDEIMRMSNGEYHEWSAQVVREASEHTAECRRYNEGFEIWFAKDKVIWDEKMKLIDEGIALKNEFNNLEDKEKWLLLSIALRSQPNLLRYI